MADSFVLRFPLPGPPTDQVEWLSVDGGGSPVGASGRGTLVEAAVAAGSRRLVVIVPGEDIALSAPELPSRSGSKLARLVPFALEEALAADVETLHFAVGKQAGDRRVPVAALERGRLSAWLAELAAVGLAPAALYPD
jgi:general secretion pathway protein L